MENLPTKEKTLTAKDLFSREDVQKRFTDMLGKKAQGFITSVLQIVQSNDLLKNAEPLSIYNAAAIAATMDLSLNANLGWAYIIPYNQKYQDGEGQWKTKQVAQFQMGYKGFIQLAQRSGVFKNIDALPIYEGQIINDDSVFGGFSFMWSAKKSDTIIGYASHFSLINGFEKTLYMPVEKITAHAKRFSKSYDKKNSIWKDDFDSMAMKTVLKLLLSKFAPLSIEMQRAVITDQAIIKNPETDEVEYVDATDQKEIDTPNAGSSASAKIAELNLQTAKKDLTEKQSEFDLLDNDARMGDSGHMLQFEIDELKKKIEKLEGKQDGN